MKTHLPHSIILTFLTLLVGCLTHGLAEEPDASPSKQQQTSGEEKKENFFQADFQNAPTYIRSAEMTFFANKRRVEYRNKVEVLHEDMKLTCDRLEALYTEDNQIDQIFAYDNVYIIRDTGTQARSEKAVYEHKTETVILTVNPEIQEKGSVVTADKITIYLQEDRSEAEGEVRVKLVKAPENNQRNPNDPTGTAQGGTSVASSDKKSDKGNSFLGQL